MKGKLKYNPFLDCSIKELEEAYEHFTFINDDEALDMIRHSFCLQAQLQI